MINMKKLEKKFNNGELEYLYEAFKNTSKNYYKKDIRIFGYKEWILHQIDEAYCDYLNTTESINRSDYYQENFENIDKKIKNMTEDEVKKYFEFENEVTTNIE